MKKIIIKIISVILVLMTLIFAFSGCNFFDLLPDLLPYGKGVHIFPEGYSGGWGLQPGAPLEYWWVETYEELIAAIELLESHGSTFRTERVFTCDEELFDVKYYFVITGDGRHGEKIKFGDDPFDRWAYGVEIGTCVFFDDVTIDELVYSLVKYYEAYQVSLGSEYQLIYDESFDVDDLSIGDWTSAREGTRRALYYKKAYYSEQEVITTTTAYYLTPEEAKTRDFKMTDESIKHMVISGKIIELNKE